MPITILFLRNSDTKKTSDFPKATLQAIGKSKVKLESLMIILSTIEESRNTQQKSYIWNWKHQGHWPTSPGKYLQRRKLKAIVAGLSECALDSPFKWKCSSPLVPQLYLNSHLCYCFLQAFWFTLSPSLPLFLCSWVSSLSFIPFLLLPYQFLLLLYQKTFEDNRLVLFIFVPPVPSILPGKWKVIHI